MSIIAVKNVPQTVSLKEIVNELVKPINGPFEALNFARDLKQGHSKICYLRLSEKLDPVQAVQNINNGNYKSKDNYHAFIPETVPDIELGTSEKSKSKRISSDMRKEMKLAQLIDGRIIKLVTTEIMSELQAKYPGIHDLSSKNDHKLLKEIYKTISSRVKTLIENSVELESSCSKATRAYRRAHPHFGDFQLVLSSLQSIQEADGIKRQELQESDITTHSTSAHMNVMASDKMKTWCYNFSDKIFKKMNEHVNSLDTTLKETDNEEEVARKQVRQELKKLQPFLRHIANQVVHKEFIQDDKDRKFLKMRIYGEPTLPSRDTMAPFLARFQLRGVLRSALMYNMLKIKVPQPRYNQLLAMNGTVLNGSKLIIGLSEAIMFKPFDSTGKEEERMEAEDSDNDQMDEDIAEVDNWDEEGMEI